MSSVTAGTPLATRRPGVGVWPIARSGVGVAFALYALALVVRASVAQLIAFPLTEGSAYYVAVARSLVDGRGLVVDTIWSYATAPLVLPRPAFELWQPMASFIAALPMAAVGTSFDAAQMGGVLLGALLAPLAWLVARDAAERLSLPPRRSWFVAVGAGALVAIGSPFLLATAVPDSTLPFTVLAVAACAVMPAAAAAAGRLWATIALGVLLGLAYLTRMEAIWLGVTFAGMVLVSREPAGGWQSVARRLVPVVAVGAIVVLPWWLRNLSVFGTPFPGQIADNVFLTRNEQIFAYLDQPSLAGFLAQGWPTIAGNVVTALWHNLVNVLLVPAAPIVLVGLGTVIVGVIGRRSVPRAARRGALAALLVSGALTFAVTSLLFPVATLWGTFEHAAGPLLVGLAVAAVLGGDAFVGWLVKRRNWQRQNAWLAPAALLALTVPLSLWTVGSATRQANSDAATWAALAVDLPPVLAAAGVRADAPLVTDRPLWLSGALSRPTLALSDEPVAVLLELAARFDAGAVVVINERGGYPAWLAADGSGCFTPLALDGAAAYAIGRECLK